MSEFLELNAEEMATVEGGSPSMVMIFVLLDRLLLPGTAPFRPAAN
jgi:bacteriocin-like protein